MLVVLWIPLRLFMVSVTCFKMLYGFRRWIVGGFCRRRMIQHLLDRLERFLACFCVFRTGFRRWFVYGFRRGRKTCLWFPSLVLLYGFRRGKEHVFLFLYFVLWFPSLFFVYCFRLLQDCDFLSDGNRQTRKNKHIRTFP